MRMSDPANTEAMKVCEVTDEKVPSMRDNISSQSEVADQPQSSRDEPGSNNHNKRDVQVKMKKIYTPEISACLEVLPAKTSKNVVLKFVWIEFKLNISTRS